MVEAPGQEQYAWMMLTAERSAITNTFAFYESGKYKKKQLNLLDGCYDFALLSSFQFRTAIILMFYSSIIFTNLQILMLHYKHTHGVL